jgi:hypothetical protein
LFELVVIALAAIGASEAPDDAFNQGLLVDIELDDPGKIAAWAAVRG